MNPQGGGSRENRPGGWMPEPARGSSGQPTEVTTFRPSQQAQDNYNGGYGQPQPPPLQPVRRHRRWPAFTWGLVAGLLVGFSALLIVALALSRPTAFVAGPTSGDPDLWVSVNSSYLNSVIAQQIEAAPVDIGVGKVTGLQISLADNTAGMTMTPTFDLNIFTIAPSVDVQLGVTDGLITAEMVGEPRLGTLSVPLDALPFDLGKTIRDGVNQTNRDVLLAELNSSLRTGLAGDQFDVVQVNTSSEYLVVKLKRKGE